MAPRKPPSSPKHWLLGDLPAMRRDQLGYERHIARTYGDVVYIRYALFRGFQVNHPDIVRQVLVEEAHKFEKAPIYKLLLSRFLGDGVFTSDGAYWRRQRGMMQPAFHSQRIQTYAKVMVDNALRLLDEWAGGGAQDISHDMIHVTLSIVAKTLFDYDIKRDADQIGDALTEMLHSSNEITQSGLMGIPEWIPIGLNRRSTSAVKALDAILLPMIQRRRAEGGDRGDLLSMLLMAEDEHGERMTDKQVRDEAATLVLAGHETTANALTWAWILLAQHPEVEAKLHEELERVLGGRTPTFEDLRKLEYTQMVLKETMRLYPPLPAIGRRAIAPVTLGGYEAKKGYIVLISTHVLQRDPRWWDDPDSFIPERFSKDNEKSIPKYAYFPFGGGPRICLGNMFAEMEAALVLATIAQRVRLRLEPEQSVEPEFVLTMRPKYRILMRPEARKREIEGDAPVFA